MPQQARPYSSQPTPPPPQEVTWEGMVDQGSWQAFTPSLATFLSALAEPADASGAGGASAAGPDSASGRDGVAGTRAPAMVPGEDSSHTPGTTDTPGTPDQPDAPGTITAPDAPGRVHSAGGARHTVLITAPPRSDALASSPDGTDDVAPAAPTTPAGHPPRDPGMLGRVLQRWRSRRAPALPSPESAGMVVTLTPTGMEVDVPLADELDRFLVDADGVGLLEALGWRRYSDVMVRRFTDPAQGAEACTRVLIEVMGVSHPADIDYLQVPPQPADA